MSAPVSPDYTTDDEEETADSCEPSDEETQGDAEDHAQETGSNVPEAGSTVTAVNSVHEGSVGEAVRERKGKTPERMSFKNELKVTKGQFLRYFPHRKPFRRMKTWAGKEYKLDHLNPDDRRMLPEYPCSRSKKSAHLGTALGHNSVPKTAAQASDNRDGDPAAEPERPTKQAAKTAANPSIGPTRRNPRRAARK